MTIRAASPYSIFFDRSGNPLNGKIYFGQEGLNPKTNPIDVFLDEALTIPGPNPIQAKSGYAYYNKNITNVYVNGNYSTLLEAIDGNLVYSALNLSPTSSVDVTFIQEGAGAVERTVESKLVDTISIFDFMSPSDVESIRAGANYINCTTAITNAHATGRVIFYPYGVYNFYGYFPECEGGAIGEGSSTDSGAKFTSIIFYNCIDPDRAAIKIKASPPKSLFFKIKNLMILSSSWNNSTGCLGFGIDISSGPVMFENVYVQGFKKENLIMHHDLDLMGPYDSLLVNVYSSYSGRHGAQIGAGANSVTLINYRGFWNGAPSFGVAPSVAGDYDGLYVTGVTPPYSAYTPENLSIVGGDCSYNSRYGWNFNNLTASVCNPGYCEGNLVNQARFGNINGVTLNFAQSGGGVQGITNEQTYTPYYYTTKVTYASKQIHPPSFYDYVKNPALPDLANDDSLQNAPSIGVIMARSNPGTSLVYFSSNVDPSGNPVDKATQTALSLRLAGTAAVGIGASSHFLKISENNVRIPEIFYRAQGGGWDAVSNTHYVGDSPPLSGVYIKGDRIDNYGGVNSGGYIGFVCTVSGNPGTWKGFGTIQA